MPPNSGPEMSKKEIYTHPKMTPGADAFPNRSGHIFWLEILAWHILRQCHHGMFGIVPRRGETVSVRVAYMRDSTKTVPVLLLHGFLGDPSDWLAVRQACQSILGVHAYDLRDSEHGIEAGLSRMVAYMDSVNRSAWDIVGYSMGGRVAWLLAYRYPQRVRRLCILCANPGISDPEARRMRAEQDRVWVTLLRTSGMASFLTRWYAQPLFDSFRQHPVFQTVVQRRALENAAVHAQILECGSPAILPDLWAWVLLSQIPTLYLSGEKDLRYTQIGEALSANPYIRCAVLPEVGHVLHLEAPVAIAAAMDCFFTAVF